jgi:hypothetical protein
LEVLGFTPTLGQSGVATFTICVGMPTFKKLLGECSNKPKIKPLKMKAFHNYKLYHSQVHEHLNFIN